LRCAAVVAVVALLPLLGTLGGGAFGFPAPALWMLVLGPVLLIVLARGDAADDGPRDGPRDGNDDGDR